jgi:DUF4097 and DUF4098 domain-containing protein YvlB
VGLCCAKSFFSLTHEELDVGMKRMNRATKLVIVFAAVAIGVLVVGAYAFLNSSFSPVERRQDRFSTATSSVTIPAYNVEIQATTFNGNIEVQPSSGNTIEVVYSLEAPNGHLNEITTKTTNETVGDNGIRIVAVAKLSDSNGGLSVNQVANISIMVPTSSQYNFTLHTSNGDIVKPLLNDYKVSATTSNGNIEIEDGAAKLIIATSSNGNIVLGLVKGTGFHIDAETSNGRLTNHNIPIYPDTQTDTKLVGLSQVTSRELSLILSTSNGNIELAYLP